MTFDNLTREMMEREKLNKYQKMVYDYYITTVSHEKMMGLLSRSSQVKVHKIMQTINEISPKHYCEKAEAWIK